MKVKIDPAAIALPPTISIDITDTLSTPGDKPATGDRPCGFN